MVYSKDNFDIIDRYHAEQSWAHLGLVYTGDIKVINDQTDKETFVPSSLAAAFLGLNNTAMPTTNTSRYDDIWTDHDAQEMYLLSKPTCYLILGKPGIGAYSLGEAISQKFGCIHLCPKYIMNDEIKQGSTAGKCLDFNLRHNILGSYRIILKILKQKLQSPAVKHRGYVISGIPLVTACEKSTYLMSPECSEEALFAVVDILYDFVNNFNKKKPKPPTVASSHTSINDNMEEEEDYTLEDEEEQKLEENATEEQEVTVELPKFILNPCFNLEFDTKAFYETKQATFLQQLQELFNLSLEPDVIIYITCPDADVVTKKRRKYINYKTNHNTLKPFPTNVTSELRWPTQYNSSDYINGNQVKTNFEPKYNCRPPINFNDKSANQLCNYRQYILPYIENKIKDYDPKQVIKIDGRTSIDEMVHQISERLLLMNINPVIIPEPLKLEDPPEDLEEFWRTIEDLSHVIRQGPLKFRYYASPWFNRCPVELRKRQSVLGTPKFAVKFFRHVYIMSSLNNFISFCRNPRPYLKLQSLEPTCRIIVTGTKSSGKTMTAECLSWIFDTPVINYKEFVENEKQKKYTIFAKTILSEIIATIEDVRYQQWQRKELDRETGLSQWVHKIQVRLKEYIPLLIRYLDYIKTPGGDYENLEEEEKQLVEEEKPVTKKGKQANKNDKPIQELDTSFFDKFNYIREQLSFLPILDSVEDCEFALENKTLSQYAPRELKTQTTKPPLPVLGDEDVTKAISEYIKINDLQKEMEPNTEEIMNEIIKIISNIDIKRQQETNSKECYGKYIIDDFPSDLEYWEFLSNAKLLPDYTIAIIENREIDTELLGHYLSIEESFKLYNEILTAINDPLILAKLQTKPLPESKMLTIQKIVYDLVDQSLNDSSEANDDNPPAKDDSPQLITSLTESIEKFRENWDSIKIRLEQKSKYQIEVELENKTDIEVLEHVLLKLRQGYAMKSEMIENDDDVEDEDNNDTSKDPLKHNDSGNLCETNIYCPITYFNHGILWEGKKEFALKYNNKCHYFANEQLLTLFQDDVTKYQAYNKPFKQLPKLKICIIGSLGSGITTLSKHIAREFGLLHVDLADIINYYYMPGHFKKVGRRFENPFIDMSLEEEGVVEFQLDEDNPNLIADILANESELRRIVYNYYERGQPIPSIITHKIIRKLWYERPFVTTGFVLDGYPRLPQDIEDMIQCNCIPDIVIDLDVTSDVVLDRLASSMFQKWKLQLREAKEAHRIQMDNEKKDWMLLTMKTVVIKLIIEDLINNSVVDPDIQKENDSTQSFVFDANPTGSTQVDPKLFSIYNQLIEENPAPVDTREWEHAEDVRERIESRLEAVHDITYENIQTMKEILEDNKIRHLTIDATKPFNKVFRLTLSKLSYLRNTTQSFLEQTFIVTIENAEKLLLQGYYFLSKFGRQCPVHMHKCPQTTYNSYMISRNSGKLFPIIHQAYIYYISNEQYVRKFRKDPLKYVTSDEIRSYLPFPLRISIIGTPKSGKSCLAENLEKRFNLLYLSKGLAVRKVLETMQWSELATKMFKKLYAGDILDSDSVMNAVQTIAIDHRSVNYGFVLDGFPSTTPEAMMLAKNGLYPNIVFDISSDKAVILENSQNEIYHDIIKYKPPYSYTFMENRFVQWKERCHLVRKWINSNYENITVINGNESKWLCFEDAYKMIDDQISKIHQYLTNVTDNIVLANAMAISNEVFEKNWTSFKNMCPACLRNNILKCNKYHGDKTGIVQYRNKFYWICPDHMEKILAYPDYYLSNPRDIPELPAVVNIIDTNDVYENGVCIVTYAENLPKQRLVPGTNKFAATYSNRTYLFCSEKCLNKFLNQPYIYADIIVFKAIEWFPRLSLKNLPNLGYLEQTLANILTEACCAVNAFRPKYPGLSFQLSALIYIALHLKTHNPRLPKDNFDLYHRALKVFENNSKFIMSLGLRMRSMENPFAAYPKSGPAKTQTNGSQPKIVKSDTSFASSIFTNTR